MSTSLTRKTLNGVWHALITPWTDDDRVDERRFAKEIRSYAGTGIHGVYTGGTTGEFYTQDDASFERITAVACENAHAIGLPIQIGCTTLSTRTARERIRVALKYNADAIQIALPFWLETKDDEAIGFMEDVAAEAGNVPLILYNTSRAKRKIGPEQIGELAGRVPTFIGMKDTGCDLPTLKAMLRVQPDIAIFGGDHDLIERIPAGGRGAYASVTGLNARRVVEYYELCAAGRLDDAKPLYEAINGLMTQVFVPMVTNEG